MVLCVKISGGGINGVRVLSEFAQSDKMRSAVAVILRQPAYAGGRRRGRVSWIAATV